MAQPIATEALSAVIVAAAVGAAGWVAWRLRGGLARAARLIERGLERIVWAREKRKLRSEGRDLEASVPALERRLEETVAAREGRDFSVARGRTPAEIAQDDDYSSAVRQLNAARSRMRVIPRWVAEGDARFVQRRSPRQRTGRLRGWRRAWSDSLLRRPKLP